MKSTRLFALTIAMLTLAVPVRAQSARIGNAGSIPNGGMVSPAVIQSTVPTYTAEALAQRIDGVVTLQASIDSNGNVNVLRVLKGLGFGLDENAVSAVKNWVFSPALRDGAPVNVIAQIDVPFHLPSDAFLGGGRQPAGIISGPKIKKRVEPKIPPAARSLGIMSGKVVTVVLEALIRKDGSVEVLSVIKGAPAGLTDSAIDAIRQWEFDPASRRIGGIGFSGITTVDAQINIEVNFNFRQR